MWPALRLLTRVRLLDASQVELSNSMVFVGLNEIIPNPSSDRPGVQRENTAMTVKLLHAKSTISQFHPQDVIHWQQFIFNLKLVIPTVIWLLIAPNLVEASCSLQIDSPLDGSTVDTPSIPVTISGQGTGAAGASWQVQGTVNGTQFMSLSGVFEENDGAVDFGGGTVHFTVPLQKGPNTLIVIGSADGCTVSDEAVVTYVAKNNGAAKNKGGKSCDTSCQPKMVADPINIATGNKVETEIDYLSAGPSPLILSRAYNSFDNELSRFGVGWRGAWTQTITSTSASTAEATRSDGKVLLFTLNNSIWTPDSDVNSKLVKLTNGWQYTTGEDETETYNANGQLISITDRAGLSQTLNYDAQGRLVSVTNPFGRQLTFAYQGTSTLVSSVTVPNGGIYSYNYDANFNLTSVTYPDNTKRSYLYENTDFPNALTGIIDEKGNRYSTDTYDSLGRDIANQLAGGVNKTTLDFTNLTNGSVTVIDALVVTRTSTFGTINQVPVETSLAQSCSNCPAPYTNAGTSTAYDANGNISSETDFNGNTTNYTYDTTRNLQLSRTEAAGTTQERTITTTWHPTFRLPATIDEPRRSTSFNYDAQGNLLQKTITANSQTRAWTYTYNTNGQPLTIDGPRTDVNDVAHFTYDTQGNLKTIADALGHVTTITSYNADGQPLAIRDANRLVTTFQYDPRGKVIVSKVGSEITRYAYDAAQQLIKITLPDASFLTNRYDDAHRLVSIADSLGNHIDYTLDLMGNRLKTEVFDPANTLTKTRTQVFDGLSRLAKTIGAQNQTASFDYDANGNTTGVNDPLNNKTAFAYDPLDRLISSIDPIGKSTQSTYDNHDNLLSVTDPLAHKTDFNYDGFGNQLTTDSPDAGQSQNNYDAAGNLLDSVDARGQAVNYSYDALNRIVQVSYPNNPAINLTYDQGVNGIGYLTQMSDVTGTTRWSYDLHGRITRKVFTSGALTLVTRYSYNTNGRLATLTYPSGKVVRLSYNNGQVTQLDSNRSPLLSSIHYQPFGPLKDWTFGNGVKTSRSFDLDGRLINYDLGGRSRQLSYDDAGRITGYTDTDLNHDQGFTYDELGRLTGYTDPTTQVSYRYDANGNRTQQLDGVQSKNFNLEGSSNRLLSITDNNLQALKNYSYDAAGHLISDGSNQFTYDGRGRLVQAANAGLGVEQYLINGLGQRVAKIADMRLKSGRTAQAITYFIYDEAGHLMGEYDRSGRPIQETVWLGDMPVAVLIGNSRYFIYADHINTPRAVSDKTGKVVWRWDSEAFGTTAANEDPDKDGKIFTFNLRLPGQYYDKGTGLHYNYFRDYDPSIGRYIQSDPIGLAGGINTYVYVLSNPVNHIDSSGLKWSFYDGLDYVWTKYEKFQQYKFVKKITDSIGQTIDIIKSKKDGPEKALCFMHILLDWTDDLQKAAGGAPIFPSSIARATLDKGAIDSRRQRDTDTINIYAAPALRNAVIEGEKDFKPLQVPLPVALP
jgi:RHS repeat-associated protein